MNKAELRAAMRARKAGIEDDERARLSAEVTAALRRHPRWQAAQTVLLYHSLPDEVCTHSLLLDAVREGRRVVLPAVVGDNIELRLYQPDDSLREGSFHILEPTTAAFADASAIDLAIIPGVAFTSDGIRLGRGRGYYDRLLPRLAQTYRIGICWPFQLLDHIPAEPHDIRMHEVVTTPCTYF